MTMTLTAPVNAYTGFGQLVIELFARFRMLGHDVKVVPLERSELCYGTRMPVPQLIKDAFVKKVEGQELVISPILWKTLPSTKSSVLFSMWECTKLPPDVVAVINMYAAFVVPCSFNEKTLRRCGVKIPIHVVRLGIDRNIWQYREKPVRPEGVAKVVFGCGGAIAHSKERKNVSVVIDAFCEAFNGMRDVRLEVKCFPGDSRNMTVVDFGKIECVEQMLPTHEMAKWYQGLDCFVSSAYGEGWGLMMNQAMSTGASCISPLFSGETEHLNRQNTLPVFGKLTQHPNATWGYWATPNRKDIVAQMRRVFFDDAEREWRRTNRVNEPGNAGRSWIQTASEIIKVVENAS